MTYSLTGLTVSGTYQRLVQYISGDFYDGIGNYIPITKGATGPTGPAGTTLLWMGEWDSMFLYDANDLVVYDNSTYICLNPIVSVPSSPPDVDTSNWGILAKGAQGVQGATGLGGTIGLYGSFYDTTTQINPTASLPNAMRFNTTDFSNGVSIVNNSRITISSVGVYNIQFSAQIDKTDNGNDQIDIWLKKNGQNVDNSNTTVEVFGNSSEEVAAWNWLVNSNSNDYYEIMWSSPDANIRLLSRGTQSTPLRPAIPSVILTVSQITYTQLGPTGSQGSQGVTGPQGFQGDQGFQGFQGATGPQGFQGDQGFQGVTGPQGFQGFQGFQGVTGPQGFQGDRGFQGVTGPQGFQGSQGATGPQGFQGDQGQGATGPQGFQGFQGATGPQGFQGDQGQGATGPQGFQGFQGATGPQGFQGDQGQGATGPQGFQGFQGATGPQGFQGDQGFQGVTGPQGFQGFQGFQGTQGFQGATGPQGDTGAGGYGGLLFYLNYIQDTNPTLTPLTPTQLSAILTPQVINAATSLTVSPTANTHVSLLSTLANLASAQTTITYTTPNSNTVDVVVSQFALYRSDITGDNNIIPPGIWDLNLYAKADGNNDKDNIGLRYFLLGKTTGGTYSNLVVDGSDLNYLFDNVASQKITLSLVINNPIDITPYESLHIVITSRNRNSSSHAAEIYYQSSNSYSHLHTSFGMIGPTGPQGPQGFQGTQGVQGTTGPQGIRGATGGFASFGSTIINLTLPIVSASSSTTFSSIAPQRPTGIWYNDTNNQYYIGGGIQPAWIERRSATFSLVSRHALSNNSNFLVSQMVGSTVSDTLIAWYGPGNPLYGIFQASNMRQIATFTPTSGSASGAFDVDFTNKLLYTGVAANGLTYVWNLGATFSGPFTLQSTLSGQNAGVYCKVDEARNRLIVSSNTTALNFYYLNASGTFSQYALEAQLLTTQFTNAAPNTSAINFDNNFYYWVIANYGIFVLDRITLNVRSYIPITSAGNTSNQVSFMGVDNVNRRLLIRWSALAHSLEVKSIDTTNGFNQY